MVLKEKECSWHNTIWLIITYSYMKKHESRLHHQIDFSKHLIVYVGNSWRCFVLKSTSSFVRGKISRETVWSLLLFPLKVLVVILRVGFAYSHCSIYEFDYWFYLYSLTMVERGYTLPTITIERVEIPKSKTSGMRMKETKL